MADDDNNNKPDDVNSSSGPVNKTGGREILPGTDAPATINLAKIAEDIGRQHLRKTQRQQEIQARVDESQKRLDEKMASGPIVQAMTDYPNSREAITRSVREQHDEEVARDEHRIERIRHSGLHRAQEQLRRQLKTQLSVPKMNTMANELASTEAGVISKGEELAQKSPGELARMMRAQHADLQSKENEAEAISRFAFGSPEEGKQSGFNFELTGEASQQLESMGSSAAQIARRIAEIKTAQKIQRSEGRDYQSMLSKITRGAARAEQDLESHEVSEEIKKGHVSIKKKIEGGEGYEQQQVSEKNIKQEIINQERELLAVKKQLVTATEEASEKLLEHGAQLADNIEKLKKADQDMGQGGGRRGGLYNQAMMAGSIFGSIGQAADAIFVGQRMQKMSNRAGFANIENEKYDTYRAALSGDMHSMMMLSQFAGSEEFGSSLKIGKNAANVAKGLAAGSEIVAGGTLLTAGVTGGTVGAAGGGIATGASAATQAVSMIASGTSNLAVLAADEAQQISPNEAKIAGENLDMETRRAITKIPAFQMQQLYNFGMGMGTAAIGMGGKAEDFLSQTTGSNTLLDKMKAMNISPEQMSQMTSFGVSEIGSTFNVDMITSARGLEMSGRGTMAENLQRNAMLAQAGANNPQVALQSVLEAAVGRGFDNSKSVTALVQHTSDMAKQSAVSMAAGVDVTGTISSILAATADPSLADRGFALERARTAQETMKETTTNVSTDLAGRLNTERVAQLTGLSANSAQFAAQLTPAELQKLKTMDDAEAQAFYRKRGIDPSEFKGGVKEGTLGLISAQAKSLALGRDLQGLVYGTEEEREGLEQAIKVGKTYNELPPNLQVLAGRMSKLTGEEYISGAKAALNAGNVAGASDQVNKDIKGEGGGELLKSFDQMRTAGFGQLADAAVQATKQFGTAAESIKALAEAAKELRGRDVEGVMSDAAAKAAAGEGGAKIFDEAVKNFDRVVNKMMEKAGLDKAAIQEEFDKSQKAAQSVKIPEMPKNSNTAKAGPQK
jgi:hypothetical protein